MRADYQLKHQLHGQQGSLWEKQVTPSTRSRIRGIVREAGNSPILAAVDRMASSAARRDQVLSEGASFYFSAGNFAVVGQQQREYAFRVGQSPDGSRLHVAYRGTSTGATTSPVPTLLARLTTDFLRAIDSASLPDDRDWYLVPIPRGMTPLVIAGKAVDTYLVNGVDFTAQDGYIVLTDDPEKVLPVGVVRVHAAKVRTPAPTTGITSSAGRSDVGRYLAEYAYKTQSLSAFKRAAAEYAGIYVSQTADVVLRVRTVSDAVTVYSMAEAGAVEIAYPHTQLVPHQSLEPGHIVSGRFDVVATAYAATVDAKPTTASSWAHGIKLDGILPVNGLSWDGRSRIPIDYEFTGTGGTPHLRLHFDGSVQRQYKFWEFQRLHEKKTGVYLYDALGSPTTPSTIDFWSLLHTFYGSQLCLVLAGDHLARINTRLWRFVTEHKPQSCNLLLGLDLGAEESLLTLSADGIPLLDEAGEDYYGLSGIGAGDHYYRPGSVGLYLRPSGGGYYLRPD